MNTESVQRGVEIIESLHTLTDFIRWGASRFNEAELFFGHGTDNAIDEAAALVLHALHLPPDLSNVWFNSRLCTEERIKVLTLLQRRIEERIPVPYLTGEAWFAGLRFHVNQEVLIPRSPIAELVENGFAPWIETNRIGHLLDLCCGSGCIGIATAVYLPDVEVELADVSAKALEVAEQNIAEHGVEGRVSIVKSDLFTALPGSKYDVIVANPPYVSDTEMARLPVEYQHEPVLALKAADNGLAIVTQILWEAPQYLNSWGILVMEVGNSAKQLQERFPDVPFMWLEFDRGGEGVFVLTAEELKHYAQHFG